MYAKKYKEPIKAIYTRESVAALLPQIGEHLMRVPALGKTAGYLEDDRERPCVVDYVNPRGLFYRVRFKAGYCQCYKVPAVKVKGRWEH